MHKKTPLPKSLVARCRTGVEIWIPHLLKKEEVAELVEQFSIEDQIDFLCVTEALSVRFKLSIHDWAEGRAVKLVHLYLFTKRYDNDFAAKLLGLKLVTSTDYLRHGKALLTSVYQF